MDNFHEQSDQNFFFSFKNLRQHLRLLKQFLMNFIIRMVILATVTTSFDCSCRVRHFPYGRNAICKRQENTCSGHVSMENRLILYREMDMTLLISFVQNRLQILLDSLREMISRNSDKWLSDRRSGSQNTIARKKFSSNKSPKSDGE